MVNAYLKMLAFLLVGYALFDRGFAYLGYQPLFIGEITLACGIGLTLLGGVSLAPVRSPIVWAIFTFAFWNALMTLPYVGAYGQDALRDAVTYGYAAFALLIAGVLWRARAIEKVLYWYASWLPWLLLLTPPLYIFMNFMGNAVPKWPGSNVPFLALKPGDLEVHYAGAGVFLALGLYRRFAKWKPKSILYKEYLLWAFWGLGVLAAGSVNRGGLLAVLFSMFLALMFRPMNRVRKLILPALMLVGIFMVADVSLPTRTNRTISVEQIVDNVASIFDSESRKEFGGTANWRLLWWEEIIDYTFFGDLFWTGRGYGVNLAETDGFHTGDHTTRSPHNGHLTILARAGVPGFLLWLILEGIIAVMLLRAAFRARASGRDLLANVNFWIFTYWMAANVNMSFDVYLEGPQGGIWFWAIVGYAIALTEVQRRQAPAPAARLRPRAGRLPTQETRPAVGRT